MPMADSSGEPKGIPTSLFLRQAIQWLTLVLLIVACVLLVYTTATVRRLNILLDAISNDLAESLATTARLSRQVDDISVRVESFGGKLKDAVKLDEVESVLAQVASIGSGRGEAGGKVVTLDARAAAEIGHLVSRVAQCDGRFEADGKSYSRRRFHLQLLAKRKAYEGSIASAEDFIERVAARTVTGKDYFVVLEDGTRKSVREWLGGELTEYREGQKL
jgi:hypothetical protein